MNGRRSRSGEFVVLGCLLGPGVALLALAVLLPSAGPHGNILIGFLGLAALVVAGLILLVQALLPKPPEPATSDRPDGAPEG